MRWSGNASPYNGSALQSSVSAPTYIPLNLQPEMIAGPPQTKRPRYFGPAADPEQPATSGIRSSDTPITVDDEDELEDRFDPESYYSSASSARTTEEVKAFIGSTFRRSIPKRKRQEIAREYPKPDLPAAKVPKIDSDILGALGGEFPMSNDKQLARIQASVLATCAPLINLWSQLEDQGLSGKPNDLIPVSEVLKISKTTLMLIGNASSYISETRWRAVINTIKQARPKLAKFLAEICKEDLGEASGDLFGPQARQKVIERANTIEAFNKALAKVESGPSNTRSMVSSPNCRFLSKRPTVRYGDRSGQTFTPYNPRQTFNKFRPPKSYGGQWRQYQGPRRPTRTQLNAKTPQQH